MEVRLDKNTLPKDGQDVKFQTVIDEDYGTWQEGIYNAKYESIYVSKNEIYDMWGDVVRWEPLSS
ncbi:hypothetical protein AAKU52_002074 [Pedobacter sp. CG_S7]|uniref:hypothetical protein n=1 Tax=Pedobacter sp. CG_S7 TaxID=3143930 RepID=UPI00339917EE